jgi:multiple antibiotic resistance protein
VTAAVGRPVLDLFGISIPAFRVAGGLVLLLVAFSMMNARPSPTRHTKEEAVEAQDRGGAVVPLAIPLLVGPGALSLVIVTAHQVGGLRGFVTVAAGVLLSALVVWLILRFAGPLAALLGRTGMNVIGRLMGILLAAIAVELLATGLAGLLPGLGQPP